MTIELAGWNLPFKQVLDKCCTFEFDWRGKVIDCTPRAKSGRKECA